MSQLSPTVNESVSQPADLESAWALIAHLQEMLKQIQGDSQSKITELEKLNEVLRQQVDAILKRFFGNRRSDSIDPAQLELVLGGMKLNEALQQNAAGETTPEDCGSKKNRRQGSAKRRKLPENLPTEEIIIDPPEVLENPEDWKFVDQVETEELDWIPGKLIRRIYIRRKFTPVKDSDRIVIAPMPPRVIDKGLPGPGLLAYIMICKFVDHLPLFRQEKIFTQRYKVPISRKSMSDWVEVVAQWLKPIYNLMKQELLAGNYLQIDETPIRYLDRQVKGKSKKGYLWVFSDPKGTVLFDWNASRSHEVPQRFIGEFCGTIQCDGYGAYKTLASNNPKLVLMGCWAHAYRKYREALEHHPVQAGWILRQIQYLYGVEKELRETKASTKERLRIRQLLSVPVVKRIHRALQIMERRMKNRRLLPKSNLGKAVSYTLNQWEYLQIFLEKGEVEIDNNLVENSIRPSALGKKNYLFFGADEAGWKSAMIYSITETCRRLNIEPLEYLTDVLKRIPAMTTSEVSQLTPVEWQKARLAEN